ncbi:MAG TPA: phosphatase PAP2 family protein [Dehalococcoidia bacterium]|nr:phosphatase PAP2 family protein [Dehalococcoidia bacterium]
MKDQTKQQQNDAFPARWARKIGRELQVLRDWRPGVKDGAEILLLVGTLPLYYLVRGLTNTENRIDEAVDRGVTIIDVEQKIGIFWEVELQSWVLSYQWLVDFLNYFYLFGHLPVIGVLAVWLYFWHKPQYLLMRNAFLISGAIALIFFVNFPTAPPRLLPDHLGYGFVDTVFDQYNTGRPWTPGEFVNEYAAFPSMHIGWNALSGIAIWLATRNVILRAFAVLMPTVMFADIVLTGNHYIIDALAGAAVMLLGLGIAYFGRQLAMRVVSPQSRAAREKGWVSWMYWLFGVDWESRERRRQGRMQTA